MFYVTYSFQVKPGMDRSFIDAWEAMTYLIREHLGGLGSRLHQLEKGQYIAYAKWPSREVWVNSRYKEIPQAEAPRSVMRDACSRIEVEQELEEVLDLIIE